MAIFDNGSYAVDHFDARGAAVICHFREDHILTDEVFGLLAKAGNCGMLLPLRPFTKPLYEPRAHQDLLIQEKAWKDSLEIHFNVTWSRSLPQRLQKLNGYGVKPYLPLLTFRQNTIAVEADLPGSFQSILDTKDEGMSYVNNSCSALLGGYKEYLAALADWAHKIGVKNTAQ
ncbi:hypothetical protein BDV12DRAFT_195160 [Aspergillus spectabilis]